MPGKKTPEEILEEAKKWIGRESEPVTNRYPVEHEVVRRFCMIAKDRNPLFLDPECAKKTKWGGVVMPPLSVFGIFPEGEPGTIDDVTSREWFPPTPGKMMINMAQEWEFFKPVMVGDTITIKTGLDDVYIKSTKIDPKSFWLHLKGSCINQKGEVCCTCTNILLMYRTPEEIAEAGE